MQKFLVVKRVQLITFVVVSLFFSGCAGVPRKPLSPGIYHFVASGQTLYSISKAYGVSIAEIMRANNLSQAEQLEAGTRIFIPRALSQRDVALYAKVSYDSVERLVNVKEHNVTWKTITLHHSGTLEGNAKSFNRNHKNRGMGGLFYHFVIGNGQDSGDGQIEVGWRWKEQVEVNRKRDIQICLVGDFNRQSVTTAQFDSLTKLLKVLMRRYSISVSHIRRHQDIPGSVTECPGRNFPYSRVILQLR